MQFHSFYIEHGLLSKEVLHFTTAYHQIHCSVLPNALQI